MLMFVHFVHYCMQFYGDTVKHMALNQLVAGSPLRTLCLLIARQPADVFSNATTDSNLPMNVSQQHTQVIYKFGYFVPKKKRLSLCVVKKGYIFRLRPGTPFFSSPKFIFCFSTE